MATDLETLVVRLEAQMKAYEREWQRIRGVTDRQSRAIEKRTQDMSRNIERIVGGISGKLSGVVAGVAAGIAGGLTGLLTGREFFVNTIEAEKVIGQLEAAIRATGGVAGYTSQQLQDMAGEIQKTTVYGDEAVMTAQTMLLRFQRIGREVFPETLKAATNLSTALGTDLTSAAMLVGRAIDDPIEGLNRLRRSGVAFTEAQKEQIKTLVQSGKGLEAQKLILAEIEARFGGAAAAARDTLGGALTSLQNAFGDLFEVPKRDTAALRIEIEKLISFLQDPSTIAAVQSFGGALFNFIAEQVRLVRNEIKEFAYDLDQLSKGNIREAIFGGMATGRARAERELRIGLGNQLSQREADAFYGIVSPRTFGSPTPTRTVPAFNTGKERTEKKDAIEREEDRINKRIKILEAETSTLGLNTGAKEKAKAAAELWAAAEKEGLEVTPELTARIDALSKKWGEASEAAELAKAKHKELVDSFKEVGSAAADAFKGIVLEGKSVLQVLDQMLKRLAARGIDRLFDQFFAPQPGAGLPLIAQLFGFGGARAEGGPVQAGKSYLVGERGPELVQFGQNGMVYPNKALAGGGGTTIAPVYNIDARGADEAAIIRLERGLARTNAALARQGKAMVGVAHGQQFGVGIA